MSKLQVIQLSRWYVKDGVDTLRDKPWVLTGYVGDVLVSLPFATQSEAWDHADERGWDYEV